MSDFRFQNFARVPSKSHLILGLSMLVQCRVRAKFKGNLIELQFAYSLTQTDLSKCSELVLFQTRGRATAKLGRVQENFLFLSSPTGEHREIIPVLRTTPVCKSSWEGGTSASL